MDGLAFAFVTIPCFGACLAAAALRDWRLAGAVASGGAGLLVLASIGALPPLGLIWSVLSGVVFGAILTGFLLALRPDGSLWTRLTVTLCAAFIVFVTHMITTT